MHHQLCSGMSLVSTCDVKTWHFQQNKTIVELVTRMYFKSYPSTFLSLTREGDGIAGC